MRARDKKAILGKARDARTLALAGVGTWRDRDPARAETYRIKAEKLTKDIERLERAN